MTSCAQMPLVREKKSFRNFDFSALLCEQMWNEKEYKTMKQKTQKDKSRPTIRIPNKKLDLEWTMN